MKLWKELIATCNRVEHEIRRNEHLLQMQLDVQEESNRKIIELLQREDFSNDEKIFALKLYFNMP